jgi:hypothetical protein
MTLTPAYSVSRQPVSWRKSFRLRPARILASSTIPFVLPDLPGRPSDGTWYVQRESRNVSTSDTALVVVPSQRLSILSSRMLYESFGTSLQLLFMPIHEKQDDELRPMLTGFHSLQNKTRPLLCHKFCKNKCLRVAAITKTKHIIRYIQRRIKSILLITYPFDNSIM